MTRDGDHASTVTSVPHNDGRKNAAEPRAFEAQAALDSLGQGRPYHAQGSDDPSRTADDALMRCYNG